MLMLNTKSDWEISMSRKILKVLISLLFLAVAAVAALLGIKNFMPDLFETPKYGTKPVSENSAHKTPAFKKDKQENRVPLQDPLSEGRKYGVAPVQRVNKLPPGSGAGKYGVAPVNQLRLEEVTVESKYGVAPVRRQDIDAFIPGSNDDIYTEAYGVAPIDYEEELLKHQNKKDK